MVLKTQAIDTRSAAVRPDEAATRRLAPAICRTGDDGVGPNGPAGEGLSAHPRAAGRRQRVCSPWFSGVVSKVASALTLVVFLLAPVRAHAIEYTLEVSDLIDDGFRYFLRGPVGHGEGELALPALARALDDRTMGRGMILYDRDLYPAGARVAGHYGAVAVRPAAYSTNEENGLWKVVRWEGKPGERVVWIVSPATHQWREVRDVALAEAGGDLRYYIPYTVTLRPKPEKVVAFPLSTLRAGEDGGSSVWDKYLSRAVDLSGGLAAVVGNGNLNGDWVYLVVENPPTPTVFRAVIAWTYRGSGDQIQAGTGRGSRR